MSSNGVLTARPEARRPAATDRLKVVHILEATSAGAARFVADVLLHQDTERFDISFVYSLIRSDARFLSDLEKIQARGIRTVEIPMARNVRPGDDLKSLGRLYRFLRKSKFDIVHAHSSKAGFLGRVAAKLAHRKTATLYSPHAIAISVNRVYGPIEKFAGLFTDAIVAVSKSEQQELRGYNLVSPNAIHYVTAAIDVKSYSTSAKAVEVRDAFGIPQDAILVGSAGRLADQKDPLTFLRIANIVSKCCDNVHFLWAGDGDLRQTVLDETKRLGLEGRVHFIGYTPDLRPVLSTLDIFTLTSRYESFGYVTCEAMAAAKPVVATNVAGSNELVRHGETGYLAEPGDAEALASHLISLVNDPSNRRLFGMAGRRRAEDHYDLSRMVSEIEGLYRSLRSR